MEVKMKFLAIACTILASILNYNQAIAEDAGGVGIENIKPNSDESFLANKQPPISKGKPSSNDRVVRDSNGFAAGVKLTEIQHLREKIKIAREEIWPYQGFDTKAQFTLVELKAVFDQLDYENSFWEELCSRTNHVIKWPNQTHKQAYGAHIFFPHEAVKLMDQFGDNSLIYRSDIKFSLMIAAAYKDPIAQIEVAGNFYQCAFLPEKFCDRLYQEAKQQLEQIMLGGQEHPLYSQAVYLFANHYKNLLEDKLELLEKSELPDAKLQALNIKLDTTVSKNRPLIADYIALGKKGLGEAYYEAAKNGETRGEKIEYLEKAYESSNSYVPALRMLVKLNKTDVGVKNWQKLYDKSKFSKGYLLESYRLMGKNFGVSTEFNFNEDGKYTNEKARELLKQAVEQLKKAVALKNPRAAHCLGVLYENLYAQTPDAEESNEYEILAIKAFLEATRLGSTISSGYNDQDYPHASKYVDELMRVYEGDKAYD